MIKLKETQAGAEDVFKLPMNVRFAGEPGQDMGGLRREYFALMLQEIFTERFGMF